MDLDQTFDTDPQGEIRKNFDISKVVCSKDHKQRLKSCITELMDLKMAELQSSISLYKQLRIQQIANCFYKELNQIQPVLINKYDDSTIKPLNESNSEQQHSIIIEKQEKLSCLAKSNDKKQQIVYFRKAEEVRQYKFTDSQFQRNQEQKQKMLLFEFKRVFQFNLPSKKNYLKYTSFQFTKGDQHRFRAAVFLMISELTKLNKNLRIAQIIFFLKDKEILSILSQYHKNILETSKYQLKKGKEKEKKMQKQMQLAVFRQVDIVIK